jgi:hypothetical protein
MIQDTIVQIVKVFLMENGEQDDATPVMGLGGLMLMRGVLIVMELGRPHVVGAKELVWTKTYEF